MKSQFIAGIVLLIVLASLSPTIAKGTRLPGNAAVQGDKIAGAQALIRRSGKVTLTFSATPPEASAKQQLERKHEVEYTDNEREKSVPKTGTPTVGPAKPDIPYAPSIDFKIWVNSALAVSPGNNADNNEPSVANSGKYVFYTGNWYVARSTDGGVTWRYADPEADFSGFCCDQDVIYDKSRDLLFWVRINHPFPADESRIRIGVSKDHGASFSFWNLRPTDFDNTWSDLGWDHPYLALSDNNLYFTINAYRTNPKPGSSGKYVSILARASLADFSAEGQLSWTFWTQTSPPFGCYSSSRERLASKPWTPVNGARDVMYIGQTTTNDCFTIWRQRESSTKLEHFRIPVPAWNAANSVSCSFPRQPGSTKFDDPCKSVDNRVKTGWLAKGTVGFFWSVAADADGVEFPQAYVNAATFREDDLSYKARPYLRSSTHAWAFAAAYPNKRGDLAIASWKIGTGIYPELYVGIDDQFNGDPEPWEMKLVAASTSGPFSNNWGHYLRVRPYAPDDLAWIVSGFISRGGKSEPRFAVFGRERDAASIHH